MFTLNESVYDCSDSLRNLIKCGSITNKCGCISINNTATTIKRRINVDITLNWA